MGNFLSKGMTYVDGVTQLNAANLNAHVDDAILKATAISALTYKDVSGTEEVMINDAGTLKKTTVTAVISTATTLLPVGTVVDFAGSAAPDGWFLCYGQSLSRTTYAALFSVIGTTYGSVDSSLFSVPDCRGRVVAGKGDMGGTAAGRLVTPFNGTVLGNAGGEDAHTLSVAEMPSHTHPFTDNYTANTDRGNIQFGNDINQAVVTLANTTGATGGGGAHNNVQPTIVLQKIIKY